jgi:hypothetical protein
MHAPAPSWLLGRWQLLRADPTLDFAPGVRMDFRPGGDLRYEVEVAGSRHELELVYAVEGDHLETDFPAAQHRSSAGIRHGQADTLILDFSGALAAFVRER